jgi:hypothetical protein
MVLWLLVAVCVRFNVDSILSEKTCPVEIITAIDEEIKFLAVQGSHLLDPFTVHNMVSCCELLAECNLHPSRAGSSPFCLCCSADVVTLAEGGGELLGCSSETVDGE